MGLNDAAEMLEVAKAENARLERELADASATVRLFGALWKSAEKDLLVASDERERARATAVRLEQELAHMTVERDRLILLSSGPGRSLAAGAGMVGGRVALHGVPVITDEVLRARAEGWRPAGGLVSE